MTYRNAIEALTTLAAEMMKLDMDVSLRQGDTGWELVSGDHVVAYATGRARFAVEGGPEFADAHELACAIVDMVADFGDEQV